MEPQPTIPSLPTYLQPKGPRQADRKEAGPLMKMMGKMMAKRLPRLGKNPNIHTQSVKIKQKKVRFY